MRLKPIAKWLVGGILSLLSMGILLLLLLDRSLSDLCENEPLARVAAPGGGYQAVAFRRNCGATTPYSMHVSVIPAEQELPNEGGNVLVVRDSARVPRLHWKAPKRLLVEYPGYADATRVDGQRSGVLIEYAPLGGE